MFKKIQQIHFVGIGGSGMSGIAEVLLTLGYKVSGSDISESAVVTHLRSRGAKIAVGHKEENLPEKVDVVVFSTAVTAANPEILAARRRGIPVIRRAEMLAELMRLKYGIAIAGTHGKTTTTSMMGCVLQEGELDPTVIVGGRVKSYGSGARPGRGEFLVAEADESDGSFMNLTPTVAVVTNIDDDHLDHYGSIYRLTASFADFVNKVPFYGFAVLCADDERVMDVARTVNRRFLTYGLDTPADLMAEEVTTTPDMGSRFVVIRGGEKLGPVELAIPGRHNVLNALAVIGTALELGIPFDRIVKALARFGGVDRRFQLRGEKNGVRVIDDYGHHPTEIKATLAAARQVAGTNRIVVIFQPHRYTRTQALFEEFGEALKMADHVILMEIYAASEQPIPGVKSELILDSLRRRGHSSVEILSDWDAIADRVMALAKPGDVVLTQGAGVVNQLAEHVVKKMGEKG